MVGRKTTFKKRNLEVVKTNFETKKARSLCLEGRNRMFPAIEVSMMPSLVSIRNWDFELVPKTTFPIPTRRPKNRFRTKDRNVQISSLKLLCYTKFRSNSSQKSFLAVKFLFFYPCAATYEKIQERDLISRLARYQFFQKRNLEVVKTNKQTKKESKHI